MRFEVMDLTVLFFALTVLGSGVVSVSPGSLKPSLLMLCFICGYFVVVNLIRSSDIIRRSVVSIVLSSFAVSLYGIYQKVAGLDQTTWTDTSMFEEMAGRVVSTLENPNVLGEYLILTIPLSLVCLVLAKGIWKPAMAVVSGVQLLCLVFTLSRGAWIGFIIGLVVLLYIYNSRVLAVYAAGLLCVPLLPAVLPESIIKRFTSIGDLADSSTSYRVSIWQAALDMLGDLWRSGIGLGSQAFGAVYPEYSLAGIESAPHSHNLFLQISIESGLIGLLLFLALVLLLLQLTLSYISSAPDKGLRLAAGACICSIIGVLVQGMTDYIWYNYRVFFMFWIIAALCVAICRCPDAVRTPQDDYVQD
ncbi:MAG: O-antigen ligase family protein [Eubacteriales bacterium]